MTRREAEKTERSTMFCAILAMIEYKNRQASPIEADGSRQQVWPGCCLELCGLDETRRALEKPFMQSTGASDGLPPRSLLVQAKQMVKKKPTEPHSLSM